MTKVVSAVPPTMPEVLPPGTEVDRYVLDNVLRDGGMATIYLGHHRTTGARVAIKVLHTDYVHQPDFIARFEREAHVMGRLSGCPQIVSVHDIGTLPDGRRYLVMDFIRGHDLRDELDQLAGRDQRMDVGRAVSLMRDVAAGLAAAHQMEVVHRDVKPSNIMLESSAGREVAKLLDFGISADLAATGRAQDLTAGGTVIGTTRYMAPEQAAGISNVATVDIWAIGVVLLEMLTGSPPPKKGWGLRGPDLQALPVIPPPLRALIEALVQTDSTQRIQSAREVEDRLIAILPMVGITSSQVISPPPPRTGPRPATAVVAPPPQASAKRGGHPMLWGMAAAGILVVGGLAGWMAVRAMGETSASEAKTDNTAAAKLSVEATPAPEPEPEPDTAAPSPPVADPPPPVQVEAPDDPPPPEPTPAEVEASTPKPKKPKPRAPKGNAPTQSAKNTPKDCDAVQQATRDASILGEWKTVLAHTKQRKCWSGKKVQRERYRVRAFHKLGRYKQCEREGQESGDPTVWSVVELCRKANG